MKELLRQLYSLRDHQLQQSDTYWKKSSKIYLDHSTMMAIYYQGQSEALDAVIKYILFNSKDLLKE